MRGMHPRTRELVDYGERCGFKLAAELDSHTHYVMHHPNGERVRISGSPGDYRGDANLKAEMRRKSGVSPRRPSSGRYRSGMSRKRYEPATERVDSKSAKFDRLAVRHRWLCRQLDGCKYIEDARPLLVELHDVESSIRELGRRVPVRSFRHWRDSDVE